jgi:diaminobutyrate-2-oxoglutarate transaminase
LLTKEDIESGVCAYGRLWPTVFTTAIGAHIYDERGREYLDFFSAASSLNYGHNHPVLIESAVSYLRSGGILNSLDTMTAAKRDFLSAFLDYILAPRRMHYRVQFTGPTGTSAVEAALRLARIATERDAVVYFSGAYHGTTLDALHVSDAARPRRGIPAVRQRGFIRISHELDAGADNALDQLSTALSRADEPVAACIIETVQGEGGVRPTSAHRLRAIEQRCREHGTLLIVDDIQAGCGRTGTFFSFENAGISPDIVCLSKSLSGLGLPLSINLIRPALDQWLPGEYSGTFRGNNLAFVTARSALAEFWADDSTQSSVAAKSNRLLASLQQISERFDWLSRPRGSGLMIGLPCSDRNMATKVSSYAFQAGLLVETCGREGEVVKLLPPLTVSEGEISLAVQTLTAAMELSDRCP